MKRILCKSHEIKSLTGLYDAIQDANIANAKEYLRSFVLKTGLRLEGDAWLVTASQGSIAVHLGACVFGNYEVFVAPPNTTVSIVLPTLEGPSLQTEPYSVILEQVDEETHDRSIRPLPDEEVISSLSAPTLRRTGVVIKIINGTVEDPETQILLSTLTYSMGGVMINSRQSESCISILSYYSSWGLSSLAPIDVQSVTTFMVTNGANPTSVPRESFAQQQAVITVKWRKPTNIGLWEVRGPLYYKARLTPVSDGEEEHPEASLEACVPYDKEDEGQYLSVSIPCCPGVYYKAEVFQSASPTNMLISEPGTPKYVFAGESVAPASGPLSLEVFAPGNPEDWHHNYFYIRPYSTIPMRRVQIFVAEHDGSPVTGDMESMARLYYDGPPKGIYYRPGGDKENVTFFARSLSDTGIVSPLNTENKEYPQGHTNPSIGAVEEMLVLKVPIEEDVMGVDTTDEIEFGYITAPWDMIISKMLVVNPYVGDISAGGAAVYNGIANDAVLTLCDYASVDLGYGPIDLLAKDYGEVQIDVVEATAPQIDAGTKIGVNIQEAVPATGIHPYGLLVFIYAKRLIS
ncbi:MAG: hypothetical protein WC455_09640 [Dehalococcoidia bacterium]|jgi:hypothetical protein